MIVLLTLSSLAALAATAGAARWLDRGPADAFVGAALLWTGLVVTPLHALGWLGWLDAPRVAIASVVLSSSLLAAALGRDPGLGVRLTRALVLRWLRAPALALRGAWRARRPAVAVGLAFASAVLAVTAWLTYLAPSSSWDGMWYHDTIAGLAIQHRGFATLDVPPALEFVNGYPKTSELLGVWLVLFWDDRLLELPTTLYAGLLLVVTHAWGRRVGLERHDALGWATALFLVPGVVLQLRSTYIDVPFVAVCLSAALFALPRPSGALPAQPAGPADILTAALGLGLLAGMKGTGLVVVPALGLGLALRALGLVRRRPLSGVGTALIALTIVVALGAPTYLRNALDHGSPTWPVTVSLPALGIEWRGVWAVEMPKAFSDAVHDVLAVPPRGRQFHDVRLASYGLVLPWLVLPLALLGLVNASVRALGVGRSSPRARAGARELLLLGAFLVPTLALSPAWYIARFNLHGLAVVMLAAGLGLGAARRAWRGLPEPVIGLLVASLAAQLVWSRPGWEVSPRRALSLAGRPAVERAAAKLSPVMGDEDTMLALERELGPGDVVLFTRDFGFPSVLWNRRFENALRYSGARGRALVDEADTVGARWVVVRDGSTDARAFVRAAPSWERVGRTSDVNVAFRRRR